MKLAVLISLVGLFLAGASGGVWVAMAASNSDTTAGPTITIDGSTTLTVEGEVPPTRTVTGSETVTLAGDQGTLVVIGEKGEPGEKGKKGNKGNPGHDGKRGPRGPPGPSADCPGSFQTVTINTPGGQMDLWVCVL